MVMKGLSILLRSRSGNAPTAPPPSTPPRNTPPPRPPRLAVDSHALLHQQLEHDFGGVVGPALLHALRHRVADADLGEPRAATPRGDANVSVGQHSDHGAMRIDDRHRAAIAIPEDARRRFERVVDRARRHA